jgi:cyclophilin family peptidyl-prolyl cis-trans isomerase
LEVIAAYSDEHPVDIEDPAWKTRVPQPPVVKFDRSRHYFWYLHTSEGVLKIELKPEWAPRRVAATIYLTKLGFYDGLKFHRIVPKFMAQGGDPLGTGAGSPGFRPYASEIHRKANHSKRGVVAMANSGPRSEGSQFYIAFDKADHLDGKHTIFGQVVGGLGTLRGLEMYGSESGKPRKVVLINRAEVRVE